MQTVKQLILRISNNPNPNNGDMTGEQADAHVNNTYLKNGWEVKSAQPLSVDQGALVVYMCLVNSQPTPLK